MGDTTVLDLPLVGEPDIENRLGSFMGIKRTESGTVRGPFVDKLAPNLQMYLYGTLLPGQAHVVNKIQGTIHAFTELATKTPPIATLKVLTVTDGGMVVQTYSGELAAQQAQSAMAQGQPPAPPSSDQTAILDASTVTKYMQSVLDTKLVKAGVDQWFRWIVRDTQVAGWQISLIDWDDDKCEPILWRIPVQQWYPDPTCEDVDKWMYCGLDWPVDAQRAKRMFPALTLAIDEAAQRTIQYKPGAMGYSNAYVAPTLASPYVTLSYFWFRDHEAKMSLQEGIDNGILELRTAAHQNDSGGDVSEGGVDAGDSDIEKGLQPPIQNNIQSTDSGSMGGMQSPGSMGEPEGPTSIFHLESGKQVSEAHDLWPIKLTMRRCVSVSSGADVVVENIENPAWDIPVVINYNIGIPNRPFGQGEPERLLSAQQDKTDVHGAMVNHATQYGAPTVIADKSAKDELPEQGITQYSQIAGRILFVDSLATNFKASELFTIVDPPAMPPAVPLVDDKLDKIFDDVSGYSPALQGQAPSDNPSGKLVESLQTAGAAATGYKLEYLETMYRRMCMLVLHYMLDRMQPEDYFRVNRTFSVDVIPQIVQIAKEMEWDVEVEVAGAASKAQRDAAVRQDFQLGIIDRETAQERLQYDVATIKMREQQQQLQALGAVPGASQQPESSLNGPPNAASSPQGPPANG